MLIPSSTGVEYVEFVVDVDEHSGSKPRVGHVLRSHAHVRIASTYRFRKTTFNRGKLTLGEKHKPDIRYNDSLDTSIHTGMAEIC